MDFETKRQKVLAYIKGLKTMPVVVTKGPAPEPVAVIDGVEYFHKQEFDLSYDLDLNKGFNLLSGEETSSAVEYRSVPCLWKTQGGPPGGYARYLFLSSDPTIYYTLVGEYIATPDYTSRAFTVVDTQAEVTDNTKICLPTCSAYYGFLSEDGKTFISYYNLKDDGAPTETIMVPVYDQNGVDPEKIEALKAIAAGGKVGEELLDEIVNFIDNPPVPYEEITHAYLTVPADSLTATFDCGTLIDGAEAKVDWGDGTVEDLTANTRMTHTYAAAGDYEVKISGMAAFKFAPYPGGTVFFKEHLREVVLSNLISEIADYAFANCAGLTSIVIGQNVTSIGNQVFIGSANLASITVDPNNQTYYSDGNCMIRTSDNVLALGCKNSVIPNGVTSIGKGAFSDCANLTSITIPDSVTSIDNYAFLGCTGLASIVIPNSVTRIGNSAFLGCTGLTSITIPDGVTSIGERSFENCTSLTSITIPDSVTSMGNQIFYGCTGLMSVTIGSGVTSIGDNAFFGCIGLTSITIPDGVTSIGWGAFTGCTGLMSVTIGSGVTSIDNYTFYNCTALTSITIPDGITSIGVSAFENCTNLAEITFEDGREAVPTLEESSAFSGLSANYKIYVQRDLLSAWKAASVWSDISDHIEGLPWTDGHIHGVFTTTSENKEVSFTPGTFIENVEHKIDWGDGAVEDLTANTAISHTYAAAGEYDFTVKGTSTIGSYAFQSCSDLTSITIPDSVTSIGISAFESCTGLTSVTIGSGVTSIDKHAFKSCTGLTSITIPNGVTSINRGAFESCSSLTSITIPDSVTSIDVSAFEYCTGLTSITIPNGVTSIASYAFHGCTGLTSITIPNGVTSIASYAFNGCTGLTGVIFEDGREAVPTLVYTNAFSNNASGRKFYVQSDLLDAWKAATNWATYAADIEALPAA